MKCPNCHAPLDKEDVFCPECGNRVEMQKKSGLAAVIISLLVLAVIIAGITIWLLAGKQDASKSNSKTTLDTQTSDDKRDTYEAENKEESELESEKDKEEKVPEESLDLPDNTAEEDYVIPQSNSKYLTDLDVQGKTAQELNYAKNEIYARHGRRFDSPELQNYFNSKSWYTGNYDAKDFDANYSASLLSDMEKKNAEFLKDKEYELAPSGYQLDQ